MSTGNLVIQINGRPRQSSTVLIAAVLLSSVWFGSTEAGAAPSPMPPPSRRVGESGKTTPPIPRPPSGSKASNKASDKASKKPATGRLFTWLLTGFAAGLATSAVIVGLSAKSKYDELMDTCARPCPAGRLKAVRNRAIVADVLWGTAAGAVIAAVVFYFVEGRGPKEKDKRTRTAKSPWTHLRVRPLVRTRTYGLSAEIRF